MEDDRNEWLNKDSNSNKDSNRNAARKTAIRSSFGHSTATSGRTHPQGATNFSGGSGPRVPIRSPLQGSSVHFTSSPASSSRVQSAGKAPRLNLASTAARKVTNPRPELQFRPPQNPSSANISRGVYPVTPVRLIGPIANLPSTNVSARKTGSRQPNRKVPQEFAPPTSLEHFSQKHASIPKPLWQMLDEEHEARSRKVRGDDLGGSARRISTTSSRKMASAIDVIRISADDPGRTSARVLPGLKLRIVSRNGVEEEESSEEEIMPRRAFKRPSSNAKIEEPRQFVAKSAARKSRTASISPPSGSDEDMGMEVDSDPDERTPSDVDSHSESEPASRARSSSPTTPRKIMRTSTSPEIMLIDNPPPEFRKKFYDIEQWRTAPKITIPLPQLKPDPEDKLDDHKILYDIGTSQFPGRRRTREKDSNPPSDILLKALESMTLSPIRMQATRQLPFLRRNLRKGFEARCEVLGISMYRDLRKGRVKLAVRYEHVGDLAWESPEVLDQWLCPLCSLLGEFETREMLDLHLRCDHKEMFVEWEDVEDSDEEDDSEAQQSWLLTVTVPEIVQDKPSTVQQPAIREPSVVPGRLGTPAATPAPPKRRNGSTISSPLPYVTMSPTSARKPLPSRLGLTPTPRRLESPRIEVSRIASPQKPTTSFSPQPVASVSSPSRSRETSATSSSNWTETTAPRPGAIITSGETDDTHPFQVPPRSNPRGPAAQKPYLPAKPDYEGGFTVWYSCRPGGECLFDLLATLPLVDFGVLAWEVIEREEELYEADDMSEEQKVIHALWARWIMLNRVTFIQDYLEGAKEFIDMYWRIIHRAAGWNALRYFLLILLANRFLTSHEVAQVILHYEAHTKMDQWYDDNPKAPVV